MVADPLVAAVAAISTVVAAEVAGTGLAVVLNVAVRVAGVHLVVAVRDVAGAANEEAEAATGACAALAGAVSDVAGRAEAGRRPCVVVLVRQGAAG